MGEVRLLLHPLSREGALIETGEMKCLERRERESEKEMPSFLLKRKLSRNLREKKTPHFFAPVLFFRRRRQGRRKVRQP